MRENCISNKKKAFPRMFCSFGKVDLEMKKLALITTLHSPTRILLVMSFTVNAFRWYIQSILWNIHVQDCSACGKPGIPALWCEGEGVGSQGQPEFGSLPSCLLLSASWKGRSYPVEEVSLPHNGALRPITGMDPPSK